MKKLFGIVLLICVVASCAAPPSISKEDQLATMVAKTLTAQPVEFTPIPTLTATGEPVATVLSSATPIAANTESGAYYIYTSAQNVNLRVQPGTLFQVSRVMPQGTRLKALGVSPGGEWVYVQNDEGINGWVGINFVDVFPLNQFSVVEPTDNQLVRGLVLDVNGLPVSGIGFALEQGSLRTDAVTDASGYFYAFLPKKYSGVWTVSFISIYSTSNAVTPQCSADILTCGKPEPASVSMTLPVTGQLDFVWK
ncbi:MAG: SH3 domain-containing protein [Chloroflexi bacterium]|nr:SH3 domain-containing protein [Chloroflexota bacterium]